MELLFEYYQIHVKIMAYEIDIHIQIVCLPNFCIINIEIHIFSNLFLAH